MATHPAGRSSSALESPSIDELLEDPESMWNNTSRPRRKRKDESSGSGFNQYMDFQSIMTHEFKRDEKSGSNLIWTKKHTFVFLSVESGYWRPLRNWAHSGDWAVGVVPGGGKPPPADPVTAGVVSRPAATQQRGMTVGYRTDHRVVHQPETQHFCMKLTDSQSSVCMGQRKQQGLKGKMSILFNFQMTIKTFPITPSVKPHSLMRTII